MMPRSISLHHIMAPELSAPDFAALAGRLGCRHVCLFTQSPAPGWRFPVVDEANFAEVRRSLTDHHLTAYGVTSFAVLPQGDVAAYEPALERSAQLSAKYASVRIADDDEARATDTFARLAELAARYGIVASIEFTGYRAPEALDRTLRIIDGAGAGALSIDPLHIVRSGASLETMRDAGPQRIGYVQLCDGPAYAPEEAYLRESAAERLAPGEGAFPLSEILALAPPGRAVSLEIPSESQRQAGVPAEVRARHAVEATRRFLAAVEPE
jgi:sugar phosphate isomerase/epimerase